MPEQARLDVLELKRLFQERIVEQVDLPDRQVVRGAPPRIDQARFFGRQRVGGLLHCCVRGHREFPRYDLMSSSSRRVWRATIRFSSVGSTQTDTAERGREMRGPPALLAASSSRTPSQPASWQTRARISTACSPMPPVKTSASRPPSA